MSTFGFITIGQSPRDEVLNSMLDPSCFRNVIQYGALDSLTSDQIREVEPVGHEHPLVTRLRDGSEVLVTKRRLMHFLQRAVDCAVSDGADALLVLCTGDFPELRSPVPIVYPDRVLTATVNALFPSGTLGVIMPHVGQMETMRVKWESPRRRFVGRAASPYTSAASLAQVSRQLAEEDVDLVVLDCMGFTSEMKASVSAEIGVPIILANRLVGRVIEEMMTPVRSSATRR